MFLNTSDSVAFLVTKPLCQTMRNVAQPNCIAVFKLELKE